VTPPETPPGSSGPEGELESAPHADERELIARCIAGDTTAFEPLVERYRQRVWRLAYQILRDREEAWDCAQEALVRAFHSLPSFRGQSAFYTWLFRITVNVATDRQRARGAQARAFGAERVPEEEWGRTTPDPGGGPDTAAVQSEQRARIRQALDALPPKARTIIMLSDVEGLSYREIAEVLRCPIGTVMSRLHNARKRLKAALGSMLGLIVWLAMSVLTSQTPAEAQVPPPTQSLPQSQSVVRFGVRVLEAWNHPSGSQPPASPGPGSSRPTAPTWAPVPLPSPGSVQPMPPAARHWTPSPGGPPAAPATPPPADVDARFRRLLPQLRALFRFDEITPIGRQALEGPLGIMQRFSIPGDRWLDVTPDQLHGQQVRMQVRLVKGEHSEMNASLLASPGAPAILGGPSYGRGVLIIILWANPNARVPAARGVPRASP
jgi:RNA polymerase sigma-70 factor (ECF subfamily)